MDKRTFSNLWFSFGCILSILAMLTYAAQQTWIVEAHGSYRYSIIGILGIGILTLVFSKMTIFYISCCETSDWYMRLPIASFIRIQDEDVALRYIQGLFLFFFLIIPLLLNTVFMQKFIHGSAYHRDGSEPRIFGMAHFNYIPLSEAMDIPFLNSATERKNRLWHYGCERSCGTTYIRFWQPALFLIFNILVSISVFIALTAVFFSREAHPIINRISRKNLKALIPVDILESNPDLMLAGLRQRRKENSASFKYDLFISYSRRDSAEFVHRLLPALKARNIRVWLDKEVMRPGLDIAQMIRIGLLGSRYSLVVLSKSFFEKQWTRAELHFLLNLEEHVGEIIIPVQHGIDEEFVRTFNRRLSLRFSLDTAEGPDALSEELAEILEK
uniref:TIR domain-containing protein n=1 Tax=Candidatus Kentrum sp. FW TaxID=2126338 RepID=A0A450STB5_9GAMM|nr:MAG: TIR domain-containing protein [Candidatus Kentron sp. FW]